MSRSNALLSASVNASVAVLMLWLPFGLGCNASLHGNPFIGDEPADLADPGPAPLDIGAPHCVNLKCRIPNCTGTTEGTTTLSGVVNIPAGNLPLYNASVYIPNRALLPIVSGASCDRCDEVFSGEPVAVTTTDVNGRFMLTGIPAGADIPLVIRLGKWRRQITIPAIQACKSNTVDAALTRLPRNRTEGDIPKVAVVTGAFDATECLLRKLGIDDSEFTPESAGGHLRGRPLRYSALR